MVKSILLKCLLIGLVLMVLALPLACAKPPPAPLSAAEFEISSLFITPTETTVNQQVTVSVNVRNIGGTEGACSLTMTIDGTKAETKVIRIAPESKQKVSFVIVMDTPGIHKVGINGLSGTFQVLKPAEFAVSNLVITPTIAEVGQTVTVTVDVRDVGEIEGSYSATLKIDGAQIETKDVTIAPGATKTVRFTFTKDAAGRYSVEVAGLTELLGVRLLSEILKELKVAYPELFHELLKLPDLEEIDAKDDEAIEDIAYLALQPRYKLAVESMLNEGLKVGRRYCTPLEALLWIAYDKEFGFGAYNPLRDYSLTRLINDAWKNTTTSQNYTSERWQNFDEVVDRLNSPKLVEIYLQNNFSYSYTRGEAEGVKSAEQIFSDKKGACYDHALFAGYCLKKNGFDKAWGARVRFVRIHLGYFTGHIVLIFQDPTDSLYYTIDNWDGSEVHGPFESVREAAEFSVREQGLESYALGNIHLETAEYEAPCDYWPVEYSSVTEPILEEEEIELKYDDGVARDYISVYPPIVTGYLIDFTPTATPFTIIEVLVCGRLYGTGWEDKNFVVEIWDKDQKILYSAIYPVTKFRESPTWVAVEIPDIQVTDKFYVHVYTGTGIREGIHMGADDSVTNEHSNVTVREGDTDKQLSSWPYSSSYWFGDKNKVNWMIRVVGTFMESQ